MKTSMESAIPLSSRPHIRAKIERFKQERVKAAEKGLEIVPNVDGPILIDPSTGMTLGRRGSEAWKQATG